MGGFWSIQGSRMEGVKGNKYGKEGLPGKKGYGNRRFFSRETGCIMGKAVRKMKMLMLKALDRLPERLVPKKLREWKSRELLRMLAEAKMEL